MASFSGFLLASADTREFEATDFVVDKPLVKRGPRLIHSSSRSFGLKRWEEYLLHSPVPLADEPKDVGPDFTYNIYIVRGYSKILILCQRRKIAEYVISAILSRMFFPPLRKVSIFVDRLIEHCSSPTSEFLITSVHGRFSGASKNLVSMSLYGEDVTRSDIFSGNHHLFNFHSCGVGRRLFPEAPDATSEDGEVVRVSSDGFVSLRLSSRSQARDLQGVIEFILRNGWVEEWVPIRKGQI